MDKNILQSPDTLSYWERETFFQHLDVAIVGSGIVGLSAAIALKEQQPALHVAVLERGVLPFGASTRNAGFACFGSMTELLDDLTRHTEAEVWSLVERRWRGLQRLRERIGDQRMEYEMLGGYELFTPDDEALFQQCRAALPDFNRIINAMTGQRAAFEMIDKRAGQFGFKGVNHLIVNRLEGQLHAGKMMAALMQIAAARGVRFFNGLQVTAFEHNTNGVRIHSVEGWQIAARKVLVATNGFAQQLFPELAVLPARNQVLITKPLANLKFAGSFHYDRGYYYFRTIHNRILLGGGRNLAPNTEQTDEFGTTDLIKGALLRLLQQVILPGQPVEIDNWWSGILGIGNQKTPILQEVAPNILVAVRMGGMGIAIGSLVGDEAAERILQA